MDRAVIRVWQQSTSVRPISVNVKAPQLLPKTGETCRAPLFKWRFNFAFKSLHAVIQKYAPFLLDL
jgi:hypothetical protein